MNPEQTIQRCLDEVARRRRLLGAWHGWWRGLVLGVGVAILGLILYKLFPVPVHTVWIAGGIGLFLLLFHTLRPWFQRTSAAQTARWVDLQLGLKERLSTALEMLSKRAHNQGAEANKSGTESEWERLVTSDAVKHTQEVNAAKLMPIRWPKHSVWGGLMTLLLCVLLVVPEYRSPARLQREKESAHAADTGKQMAELIRQTMVEKQPTAATVQQSLEEVLKLGDEMARLAPGKQEAIRELSTLQQKLDQQWKDMQDKPAVKSLQKAAQNGTSPGATAKELARKMEEMKEKLGAAADQQQKVEAMKQKLERMEAAAKDLAAEGAKGEAAREAMAKELAAMAADAKASGLPSEELQAAADALRRADDDMFVRDIQAAMTSLEKLQEMQQSMQQMKDQMEKLAKDLPTQLENGQLRAAVNTLEKMMEKLRSADPSTDPLKDMAKELAEALKHAEDLGELPEHLKKALEELQKCNKPGGGTGDEQKAHRAATAEHLAKAAKELESLLEQSGDAEQMTAAMEALQRAQMAMGTGQKFGQCRGTRPGFGQGGKPGRGVGTWAEEEGWTQIPEQTEGWDNSGIKQQEMDGRGLTDRDADLNPNLDPTRLQGKMSPGQSMPSVPLKGFHIKGSSSVRYQEAAGAAQSDAQKALNQDKVPKVYQKAVKDYFDDLK